MKAIQRSKGRSSVASVAYRARTKLHDERTGLTHDYRKSRLTQPLIATSCFAPDGTPLDREKLWNAAELADNRKNSMTAREVEVALPSELSKNERVALAFEYARGLAERYRAGADVTVHGPDAEGDERNIHAHILFTTREFSGIGDDGTPCLGAKCRDFNMDDKKISGIHGVDMERVEWERACNRALEKAGLEERINHRSLKAQGIDREPGVHLGPQAMAMGRRGVVTERQGIENDMTERLLERAGLEAERSEVDGLLEQREKELEQEKYGQGLPEGPQARKAEADRTKPLPGPMKAPPGPDLARMGLACVAVSRVEDIEAMKKAGLNPARVSFEKPELVCELKAWRNMTEAEVREVWKAVQEVAPEARPCGRAGADAVVVEDIGATIRPIFLDRAMERDGPEL
jgi:hypothetical protein